MAIQLMGKFTAIGMRAKVEKEGALVISTCSQNDSVLVGTATSWSWCNPTNRVMTHKYENVAAVSVESLWQACKLMSGQDKPDPDILAGNWRKNKGKRPKGAYAGSNAPLITSPGEARRRIYLPAFRNLVEHWLRHSEEVRQFVIRAATHKGNVYLRDFDTGRGLDRNGPLSHAWILASFLNDKGDWPDGVNSREQIPADVLAALDA